MPIITPGGRWALLHINAQWKQYKTKHSVSAQASAVVGLKAQKQKSTSPSRDVRGVVRAGGRTGPVWRSHGPWASLVP